MEKIKIAASFAFGVLLAAGLTFYIMRPTQLQLVPAKEPELEAKTGTTVAYVPKESPQDPDAEISAKAPEIKVRYNEKTYELPGVSGEQHKFDKGKLTVETKTETTLDVTGLVSQLAEAKRPRHAIGIWQTTEGPAASYGYYIAKNKKLSVMAAVPDVKKFAAVGLEITF